MGCSPGDTIGLDGSTGGRFHIAGFRIIKSGNGYSLDRPRHGPATDGQLSGRSRAGRFHRDQPGSSNPNRCATSIQKGPLESDRRKTLVLGWSTTGLFPPRAGSGSHFNATGPDDLAAIIFTTGSTGPPKGVHFSHKAFETQAVEIQKFFDIQPGEIDVPCFPFFGLFNTAIGVTSIIPDMDTSRPAKVDPAKIVEAITDWKATQTFGSPAVWNKVGRYCEENQIRLDSVRRVLSSGAPLAPKVLRRMADCINESGQMHTPYGATESLPVASIGSDEVLGETAELSRKGAGTCVGHRFGQIDWRVIQIDDEPIRTIGDAKELPPAKLAS